MENRTTLRWGAQEVGRLTAAPEGADTCFRAEYRLTEGLWRLYAVGRQNRLLLGCAVLFSFQIMTVDHFAPQVDGVRLSLLQFFVVAVESTAAALLFENPTLAEFGANWLPLAYCGVMSSGVAYTLQILGQRDVNPAIASLIMCLESVFSALGGWLLLHQSLSMREIFGCTLIFAAVVLAQLPVEDWLKCRSASRK